MKRPRAHRWLVLVPVAGFLIGTPFANHVRPWVFGLPFLLFWVVACVLATSGTLAIVHGLDRRAGLAAEDAASAAGEPDRPAADPAAR